MKCFFSDRFTDFDELSPVVIFMGEIILSSQVPPKPMLF